MFKKKQQAEATLRRARFGGIRKDDVDRVVAELHAELAQAEAANRELTERVTSAEGTLEAFDASLRHMGTIISLAEQHARGIEEAAEADAARIRDEADHHALKVGEEVEELLARRQDALDAIGTLLSGLSQVTSDPEPEMPAEPELEPVAELHPRPTPSPEPAPVTVADLMAMQPDLGF
jgi:cell division septum initiation protein DivIVA